MTILKADGLDGYTTLSQRWNTSTSGLISTNKFRTGRAAVRLIGGNLLKHTFAPSEAHATYGVHFGLWREGSINTSTYIILYGDAGATTHLTLVINPNGSGEIRRGTQSGTVLASFAAGSFPSDMWNGYELKALLSDTVGTFEIRKDGNPTPIIAAITAQDTKNAGTNVTFDAIGFVGTGTGSVESWFDDIVVWNGAGSINNDFIGDTEVVTLFPNGDGATINGTPSTGTSHYVLVNEVAPNTTNYNTLVADGDLELYDFDNLTNTGGIIRAVQSLPFSAKVGSDAAFLQDTLRISGSNYSAGSIAQSTSFAYYPRIREVSPATSAAFTAAIINAMQAGQLKKDT